MQIVWAFALTASCIPQVEDRPFPSQPQRQSRPPPTEAATLQCRADLTREGVRFRPLPDRLFGGGCSALGTVQLTDIGTPVTNLGAMTCPLARQFARWAREAVQPAAQQWLRSPVRRIESMGSYACRGLNGQAGARLSEHAFANAVDIGAFVLGDGRRITVREGWNDPDSQVRGFLRAVHQAGCRRFGVTLGPDANAQHHDHLHFDLGRGPYCR
jgi:hypothetical protein